MQPVDFNSYGARRGNDRVMTRGTFANIRIRNLLAPGTEGGVTRHLPDGQVMPIYDAAMKYKAEGVPLVVLAGAEYGTGSSRDWAAKGTYLLGVRAVLAVSFERIHRSNLVGMGILPLEFPAGKTWESLGLTGEEVFEIPDLNDRIRAALADHRPRHGGGWQREGVPGQGPHRHAGGDGLLSQRRDFADGAEEAGEGVGSCWLTSLTIYRGSVSTSPAAWARKQRSGAAHQCHRSRIPALPSWPPNPFRHARDAQDRRGMDPFVGRPNFGTPPLADGIRVCR